MEHSKRFGFPSISRKFFDVQRKSSYRWKDIETAGDLRWFIFQYVPFSISKIRGKRNKETVRYVNDQLDDKNHNGFEFNSANVIHRFKTLPGVY